MYPLQIYKKRTEMAVINATFSIVTFSNEWNVGDLQYFEVLNQPKGKLNAPMIYMHRYLQ